MTQEQLEKHAIKLLRESPEYLADARQGAPVGNSVVGSLLSIQFQAPRQCTEQAVRAALDIIDSSQAESIEPDNGGNYTLRRTGQRPLAFQGELLAQASGKWQLHREHNRWHEIQVYETAGGKYIVAIAYRTIWEGEADHSYAEVCDEPTKVADVLREYDPIKFVVGYPAGSAYAERQARLIQDIQLRYDTLVSEVLSDERFAERIG